MPIALIFQLLGAIPTILKLVSELLKQFKAFQANMHPTQKASAPQAFIQQKLMNQAPLISANPINQKPYTAPVNSNTGKPLEKLETPSQIEYEQLHGDDKKPDVRLDMVTEEKPKGPAATKDGLPLSESLEQYNNDVKTMQELEKG